MLYTTDGKPINPRDFFEIKVYSLKMSKEFQDMPLTKKEDGEGSASSDNSFSDYKNKLSEITKQLISGADLLQIDQLEDTLYLPIPNSIEELISHVYKEDPLNIGEIVKGAAVTLGGMAGGKATGMVNKITKGNVKIPNMNIVSNLTEFAQQMMMRSNIILDPGLLLMYESTNPRSFHFSFILMPQNSNDSKYYQKVIDLLKSYSKAEEKKILGFLPTLKQDKIFTFNFGGINNQNSLINDLMKTDDSERKTPGFFISNIDLTVNNPSGYVQTFEDGMPTYMSLDIVFEERKPLFFKFWEDNQKQQTMAFGSDSSEKYNKSIDKKITPPKTSTFIPSAEDRKKQIIEKANSGKREDVYEDSPLLNRD